MNPRVIGGEKPPSSTSNRFSEHLMWVLLALFAIWGVHVVEGVQSTSFADWGLFPRTAEGLIGVLTMPFLHGDVDHIVGNSFGLFVLGLVSFQFYERETPWVVLVTMLGGGFLVWCFARPVYHIGSSGIVYGLSAFLFFGGILNRGRRVFKAPSLIVVMLFGSSVWGIFPVYQGVSWEGHLFGALSGLYMAAYFRQEPPPVEDDEEEGASVPKPQTYNRVVPIRRLSQPVPRRPFSLTEPVRPRQLSPEELAELVRHLPEPIRLKPERPDEQDSSAEDEA